MTKIEYRTLNDHAYERIRQGLMTATFRPGQVLVIRTLASAYGISTTPVREALQRLVTERLLTLLPNRSIAVPELDAQKFVDIQRIRRELEGLAAELAATRIRKSALSKLSSLLTEMDASLERHNHAAYRAQNQAFHFAVYAQAGSDRLFSIIGDLWGQTGPYMSELFGSPAYEPKANEAHRALVDALQNTDSEKARAAIVEDLAMAAAYLVPHLEALQRERRPAVLREAVRTKTSPRAKPAGNAPTSIDPQDWERAGDDQVIGAQRPGGLGSPMAGLSDVLQGHDRGRDEPDDV